MSTLMVNKMAVSVEVQDDMPLLWVLRDELDLKGTKFGCGKALCGACTVHLDGQPIRSCVVPVGAAVGKQIQTIEALSADPIGRALQLSWVKNQVPQCGYCQSGMLMAAAALLREKPSPSDMDIDAAVTNICRCGTYSRVRIAIHDAARSLRASRPSSK